MIGSEGDTVSDSPHDIRSQSGAVVLHSAVLLERPNVVETKIISHDVDNMWGVWDYVRSCKKYRKHVGIAAGQRHVDRVRTVWPRFSQFRIGSEFLSFWRCFDTLKCFAASSAFFL